MQFLKSSYHKHVQISNLFFNLDVYSVPFPVSVFNLLDVPQFFIDLKPYKCKTKFDIYIFYSFFILCLLKNFQLKMCYFVFFCFLILYSLLSLCVIIEMSSLFYSSTCFFFSLFGGRG